MKCNYSIEDIINYAENVLPEESKAEMEQHIKSCEKCKKAYAAMVFTEKFSSKEAPAGDDFHLKILDHLDKKRYEKNKAVLFKIRSVLKPAIAVAACFVVLMTSFMYREQVGEFVSDTYKAISNKEDVPDKEEDLRTDDYKVVDLDKLNQDEVYTTAVINPCTGKKGPGSEYEDIINLPYGTIVRILGRHTEKIWCLAVPIPGIGEKPLDKEFWVSIEDIDPGARFSISFENCSVSVATRFNSIIQNESLQYDVKLMTLPDSNSAPIADVKNGDLVCVLRQEGGWSLVRALSNTVSGPACHTGWINNADYTLCKKNMTTNQGFILKDTKSFESPDESSNVVENLKVKGLIAPVTLEETRGDWTLVTSFVDSPNSHYKGKDLPKGWVKTKDIITSFEDVDTYAITNPPIDKADFAEKIRNEIADWVGILSINAYDTGNQITLNTSQREMLANSLTLVDDIELFDGGVSNEREAVYPFYCIDFNFGALADNLSYSFVVAGDDRLVVNIPFTRYEYYGFLNNEGVPVRFIKVNKEFVDAIKSLLPPPSNTNRENFNFLLNAQKVLVSGGEGTGPQVYKCARAIKKYLGNEIKTELIPRYVPNDAKQITSFEFIFSDSSPIKIVVTDKYILYDEKYYTLKGNPENILAELFAGYF